MDSKGLIWKTGDHGAQPGWVTISSYLEPPQGMAPGGCLHWWTTEAVRAAVPDLFIQLPVRKPVESTFMVPQHVTFQLNYFNQCLQ